MANVWNRESTFGGHCIVCRLDMAFPMRTRALCIRHCDSTCLHRLDDLYGSLANGIRTILAELCPRMERRQFATRLARRAVLYCDRLFDFLLCGNFRQLDFQMRRNTFAKKPGLIPSLSTRLSATCLRLHRLATRIGRKPNYDSTDQVNPTR